MNGAELVAKLFAARTAAHMAHLQTNSFATHKALDEFYNGIVELADSFAETYQGYFGLMMDYPSVGMPTGKPVDWIPALAASIEKSQAEISKGKSSLSNICDEITGFCAQITYKLKYLDNPAMCETPEKEAMESKEYMGMSKW